MSTRQCRPVVSAAWSVTPTAVGGCTCGAAPPAARIGCCDDSLSRHATAHWRERGHPIIRSFEPGEDWFWDYESNSYYEGPELAAPQCHPLDQVVPGPSGRCAAQLAGAAPPAKRMKSRLLSFSQLSLFFIFGPLWTRTLSAPQVAGERLEERRKETHQMLPPRWLARLTIPVMAGAALVASTAIATADPSDGAYLAQLHAQGFDVAAGSGP